MTPIQSLGSLDCAITAFAQREAFPANRFSEKDLQQLATIVNGTWSTYWRVDAEALVLVPDLTWKANPAAVNALEQDTIYRRLTLSEGAAGHVWRSRKPVWTLDLMNDMCLPRSLDAQRGGLQGGLWFAIKSNQAVYGVMEILGADLVHADPSLLLAVEHLGMVLGDLVEKGRRTRHDDDLFTPTSKAF